MTTHAKIKFPMDLTHPEMEALTEAAKKQGFTKKGLIFSALKKAYNVDLEAANNQDNNQQQKE